jgi:hypothetical protein
VLVDALEARHHGDAPRVERGEQPLSVDRADARAGVRAVGADADLVAEERPRRDPTGVERDREQRRGHLLAARHDDVALARQRLGRQRARELQEPVGLARHRRHHDDQAARARRRLDAPRDLLDALDRADRGAAELLDDERLRCGGAHAATCPAAPSAARTRDDRGPVACRSSVRSSSPAP